MEDCSSSQSLSNLHHRHRTSCPLTMPCFQSSKAGCQPAPPSQDSLEPYGSKGEESLGALLMSNPSFGPRRGSNGGDRVFLSTSGSSLDGETSLGVHFDANNRLGTTSHFDDSWYEKKEIWDDREGESPADNFHGKTDCYGNTNDVFYTMTSAVEEGDGQRTRANYNNYAHAGLEVKSEPVYDRNMNHFTKQTTSYNRGGAGSADYCRADSEVSDNYLGGEEDYGSSCGSGEDQLQPAEAEGPWLSISPTTQAERRWREPTETRSLASGYAPQRSPVGVSNQAYTQKLDSFSDAFLSQRKRRFAMIPGGNSSGQIWEYGVGKVETSRQSCAFDSDTYLPAATSSSSPGYPSLPSFPSPPTSSHLMPLVLSPPPTPLPPPSNSPSKMDSPGAPVGNALSVPQGGESVSGFQFFAPRFPSLPAVASSGMIWKFPVLPHCFPRVLGDPGINEGSLRSCPGDDYSNAAAKCDLLQSPEASNNTSSSQRSSLHSSISPRPPISPSFHASLHLPVGPSHLSDNRQPAENTDASKMMEKVKKEPVGLPQSHLQQQPTSVFTGMPFPSILHSKRAQIRARYTPRPLLNPVRQGTGLYSSLSPLHHREDEAACGEQDEECFGSPHVNVGPDFQADVPPCFGEAGLSGSWPPEEVQEELLWKPWDELNESAPMQDQVGKLLSMCSSSCLPGGGSNTELALHCLHRRQGNTMATLEMLLFSQDLPTGDYHYSGCDFWTDAEKRVLSEALGTYGKDFSLIAKMVRTKTVSQCVEFYYLSKKLVDKQKKHEEEYKDGDVALQKNVPPIFQPVDRQPGLEEVVPVPSLASFFPCKLCGKMFYKIKSRNAHMKIHRQPQDDWSDRRLQHQILRQRLALSHPTTLMPSPGSNLLPAQAPALTFSSSGHAPSTKSNADNAHNSVTNSNPIAQSNTGILDAVTYSNSAPPTSHEIPINNADGDVSNRRETHTVLPFHQSWGSFGHPSDLGTFFGIPDGKEYLGTGSAEGKELISWQ
ncbi:uncharacterized protein LOC133420282 isoform X2 [Cololabis saira]|nr:uncharacterized protein LOC133420282 isoform X2 [Cololabis saira]